MASKTILITGCSAGGIGSALAESFQKRGLHVFATARSLGKMSHLEKLSNMTLLPLDATSQSSVQSAVESVKAATGGTLDYLVNNAGQGMIMPTLDVDIEAAKAMYDINVWGFLRVTQAFVPLLVATKGTLVNISSIAIGLHTPWMGVYAGSKCAMHMISETLQLELAPLGVKVVTVVTGAIDTLLLPNAPPFSLPPSSQYKSIEKEIAARTRGEDGTPRTNAAAFAEKVVGDVLGKNGGTVWRGSMASVIWWAGWFPSTWLDSMLLKGTGLDVMWKAKRG